MFDDLCIDQSKTERRIQIYLIKIYLIPNLNTNFPTICTEIHVECTSS